MDKIEQVITRRVAEIYPSKKALEERLRSGKKIRLYLGVDPTSTKLHLGNAIPLWKLQEFVELGHEVIFLIGDFTVRIGDPSDKDQARPMLTPAQIEANFADWKKQAAKILNFDKVTIRYNSEWLSKLTFAEILDLSSNFTVQQMLERERFQKRIRENVPIGLSEFLYPLMQGYDSVAMDVDLEVGGVDQTFNMLAGRILMKKLKNKEKFVLTTAFPLTGTDGRKMSKSYGNGIYLDDAPEEMYGKVMSIKDDLLEEYFEMTTNLSDAELEKMKQLAKSDPMEAKKRLAGELVRMYHGEAEAKTAAEKFEMVHQKGQTPSDIKTVSLHGSSEETLAELVARFGRVSRSEAKRLIEQGAVDVDGEKKTDPAEVIKLTDVSRVMKIGKRNFVKITV